MSRAGVVPPLARPSHLDRPADQTYGPPAGTPGRPLWGPGSRFGELAQGGGGGPHLQEGRGGRIQFGVALHLRTDEQPVSAEGGEPLPQLLMQVVPPELGALSVPTAGAGADPGQLLGPG